MYAIFRQLFFRFEPERAHALAMGCFRILLRMPLIAGLIRRYAWKNTDSPRTCFGLTFRNGIGLGAGFDKNAHYLTELHALGFGFIEIGTVTPRPQEGNPQPRLFRLPKDQALINRMGFNNDGAAVIADRLSGWRKKNPDTTLIIGGNIGKNKATPAEQAAADYLHCFEALHPFVDYFVVNVSSPNTPGLRDLQEKEALRRIFNVLRQSAQQQSNPRPILLKIAPDLERDQVFDILSLWGNNTYDGLIVSNTTIDRHGLITSQQILEHIGAGGLSGKPLREKSTDLITYIHQQQPSIPIIGSGGVFIGSDVLEKQQAGASLMQVWTGFIYEGPFIVRNIFATLNKQHGTSFHSG